MKYPVGIQFMDYWYGTGTPEFLARMMRQENFNLENLSTRSIAEIKFNTLDTLKSDQDRQIHLRAGTQGGSVGRGGFATNLRVPRCFMWVEQNSVLRQEGKSWL